jgi:hypothetical protein
MQYEANKIYVGNNEKFTLISVDDTEIRAIEKAGLIDDHAGGMKTVYHYVVLQRMTDKELQETRDTYWVNAKDLSRPMTREDLIHKWVLMTYTDNHIATHVSNDRNVDKAYIQFFEDGTVTVKDGVGVAAYKGTFDIQFNNNESATISLKFADAKRAGGFFQKNVWQSTELRLTAAAYLTLAIDEGTGFFLQRYPINDTNVDDPRSNPDDSDMLYPLYSSNIINWGENSRTWHYENVGYWKVLIDEGGRYRGGYFWGFDKPDEPLEELYAAPSSIEELNGFLYTLDDDYELRLDTIEVYNPDYYGFPRRGEFYHEYYKGVRVFGGGYSYHITETPQGERIYCATGQIITFEPLDVVPTLTAQQALETFSKYQKEPIDPSWVCQLLIREYNIKTEIDEVYAKLARREHRLVYIVVGPEYEYRDRDNMIRKARVRADIDAHTGQIIVVESGII